MDTATKHKDLEVLLADLQSRKYTFEEIAAMLFMFDYEDFDYLFHIKKMEVPNETYLRMPIYKEDCVAILKIWGIDNATAIHDNSRYDGRIKVLKGSLTEVRYRENSNFIEYNSSQTAEEGQTFPLDYGGIHSIVNVSDDISVSLHLYKTNQTHLEGVKIFDTVHRKIAWLSQEAKTCSWKLPENAYTKIIKV